MQITRFQGATYGIPTHSRASTPSVGRSASSSAPEDVQFGGRFNRLKVGVATAAALLTAGVSAVALSHSTGTKNAGGKHGTITAWNCGPTVRGESGKSTECQIKNGEDTLNFTVHSPDLGPFASGNLSFAADSNIQKGVIQTLEQIDGKYLLKASDKINVWVNPADQTTPNTFSLDSITLGSPSGKQRTEFIDSFRTTAFPTSSFPTDSEVTISVTRPQ